MKILITSAGSQNGANVIKALRETGYELIACDADKMSAGLYLADKRYITPKASDKNFIPTILKIVEQENIDMVIPTYSTEFAIFAEHADKFKGKIVLSSLETYKLADDKPRWMKVVADMGIDVPEIEPKEFPKMIKPITGSGSKNQWVIKTDEEYKLYKNDTNFCSKFIEGQEYVVDGMCDLNGKMISAIPRIRLEARGGGAKKCITIDNPKMVELAKKIVEKLGLVGAFNVQCVENNGRFYFIDVNNRFPSGGMPLAVASGINMPLMLIQLLKGEKVEPELIYGLIMLRYDDEVIIDGTEIETYNTVG